MLASTQGWRIYTKIRHAKRLKIGVQKFKLLSLSLTPVSNIVLSLGNFSSSTFIISQIKVDAYTRDGQLLAEQTTPLAQPFTLNPNQNSALPLSFAINATTVISALKAIGGLSTVAANFLTSGTYGLPIVLKGFVEAENIQIPIEESLTI
ncbi:hypothetical protein [Aquimarina algiphila]|uniref:Late embryogenesis abundant protein LEA-2 subgroup domain-containing protein n=1 Tax=Aquimarina algiphila TaxID=2047982 RepID=A0A554VNQ8_9FLAO|nr:hypothetical protein [Aquimarina algiphila]TSE10009.1 hypothetical protein FOF46_06825 [Aquimarina algiphila]